MYAQDSSLSAQAEKTTSTGSDWAQLSKIQRSRSEDCLADLQNSPKWPSDQEVNEFLFRPDDGTSERHDPVNLMQGVQPQHLSSQDYTPNSALGTVHLDDEAVHENTRATNTRLGGISPLPHSGNSPMRINKYRRKQRAASPEASGPFSVPRLQDLPSPSTALKALGRARGAQPASRKVDYSQDAGRSLAPKIPPPPSPGLLPRGSAESTNLSSEDSYAGEVGKEIMAQQNQNGFSWHATETFCLTALTLKVAECLYEMVKNKLKEQTQSRNGRKVVWVCLSEKELPTNAVYASRDSPKREEMLKAIRPLAGEAFRMAMLRKYAEEMNSWLQTSSFEEVRILEHGKIEFKLNDGSVVGQDDKMRLVFKKDRWFPTVRPTVSKKATKGSRHHSGQANAHEDQGPSNESLPAGNLTSHSSWEDVTSNNHLDQSIALQGADQMMSSHPPWNQAPQGMSDDYLLNPYDPTTEVLQWADT